MFYSRNSAVDVEGVRFQFPFLFQMSVLYRGMLLFQVPVLFQMSVLYRGMLLFQRVVLYRGTLPFLMFVPNRRTRGHGGGGAGVRRGRW